MAYIARLTATATFAYLLALLIPAATARPVLAPLTALLVLQASLYQTIHSAIRKVASVIAGVLIAVAVAEFIGFSWWQLGLVIGAALVIGRALRLGDDLLEVPISAMLIFSSAGTHAAADGRVVDTLVGAAAGLAGGLVFGAPRVQPAREAIGALAGRLADLLSRMADDLSAPGGCPQRPDDQAGAPAHVTEWLTEARSLRDEIEKVDDTLRQAADSVRLNPRSRIGHGLLQPVPDDLLVTEVALRGGLETLEHATVTVRGLARSVLDSAGIHSDLSPVRDEATRARLAGVLGRLAEAIRTYGRLAQLFPAESEQLSEELARQLAAAHREQDKLAAVLEPPASAEGASSEWPLRGEILNHVDRLRTGLRPEAVARPELSHPLLRPRARSGKRRAVSRDRVPQVRVPQVRMPRVGVRRARNQQARDQRTRRPLLAGKLPPRGHGRP